MQAGVVSAASPQPAVQTVESKFEAIRLSILLLATPGEELRPQAA